jgi:prepilin-type processing-associated H-X9-DG protein
VKSTGIYTCPDDATVVTKANNSVLSYAFNADLHHGYGYPTVAGGPVMDTNFGKACASSELAAPASTVLLCEVQNVFDNTGVPGTPITTITSETNSAAVTGGIDANTGPSTDPENYGGGATAYATGTLAGYPCAGTGGNTGFANAGGTIKCIKILSGVHSDGSNYLCADGHVKWLRGTAVTGGARATASNLAQTTKNAAGTANLQDTLGNPVVLTFSPT